MIKPYILKELSDKEMTRFLDHVSGCPECYEELELYYSIHQTLESSRKDREPEEYNFRKKLELDIRNTRRYIHERNIYRLFHVAIILIAEVLLVLTMVTGAEYRMGLGVHDTTVYRIMNGGSKRNVRTLKTETEAATEIMTDTVLLENRQPDESENTAATLLTDTEKETAAGTQRIDTAETAAD